MTCEYQELGAAAANGGETDCGGGDDEEKDTVMDGGGGGGAVRERNKGLTTDHVDKWGRATPN